MQIYSHAIPLPRQRRLVDSVCFHRRHLLPRYRRRVVASVHFHSRPLLLPPWHYYYHYRRCLPVLPQYRLFLRRLLLLQWHRRLNDSIDVLVILGTTTFIIVVIVCLFYVLLCTTTTSFCLTTTTIIRFEIVNWKYQRAAVIEFNFHFGFPPRSCSVLLWNLVRCITLSVPVSNPVSVLLLPSSYSIISRIIICIINIPTNLICCD